MGANLFMAKGHTHIILGWFVGQMWINNKWCTYLHKLFWNFYSMYIIYKFGCGLHGTTWWATSLRHTL